MCIIYEKRNCVYIVSTSQKKRKERKKERKCMKLAQA